jgi:hypothetical protein
MTIKRMDSMDRILDFLEENIDEEHCEETERLHLAALNFKQNAIPPLRAFPKLNTTIYWRF